LLFIEYVIQQIQDEFPQLEKRILTVAWEEMRSGN